MINLKYMVPFSISEKIEIIKHKLGNHLVRKTPKGLIEAFQFVNQLKQDDIRIKGVKGKFIFSYPINQTEFKFELKKMSSDINVFKQIIIEEEYLQVIKLLKANNIDCQTMIDAGANIGLTSIFFKAFYPELKIIAIEPSNDSFFRLENNIKINNFKKITLLKKGLWSHSTRLKGDNSFRDGRDWSFRLVEASNNDNAFFEVISLIELINDFKLKYIDFLKIDIEGSEKELFKKNAHVDWLKKVKILAIEIHDEFNCRENIEQTLIDNYFELSHSGELTIGINKKLIFDSND